MKRATPSEATVIGTRAGMNASWFTTRVYSPGVTSTSWNAPVASVVWTRFPPRLAARNAAAASWDSALAFEAPPSRRVSRRVCAASSRALRLSSRVPCGRSSSDPAGLCCMARRKTCAPWRGMAPAFAWTSPVSARPSTRVARMPSVTLPSSTRTGTSTPA